LSFYCRTLSPDSSENTKAKNNIVLLPERATAGSSFAAIENRLFLLMDCNGKLEIASNKRNYKQLVFSYRKFVTKIVF